jgi:hypothetical protein
MLVFVRFFFFLGLLASLVCFALFLKGRGEHYKHLGFKTMMVTLFVTVIFFLIAIVQKVFLEN